MLSVEVLNRDNAGRATADDERLEDRGTVRRLAADGLRIPVRDERRIHVLGDVQRLPALQHMLPEADDRQRPVREVDATLHSVDEADDLVVLVVDAAVGITDQDQRIAREAYEAGRGIVVAVNKWDLLRGYSAQQVERVARAQLRFLSGVRICPTSALRHEGIRPLMDAVFRTAAARASRIATGPLNRAVTEAVAASAPAADSRGRRLHIYYATQPESEPPTIVLFVNNPALMTPDYQRYLERRLRETFDLAGTPIRWTLRGRRPPETARTSG